ncbi:MAG TPA: sigma-70 family RNA polymerase sigma factor [Polyangiaceae bacterium LLY-WYZ-15_(1-7)]|nr:hypothetical protein [Sandaracinus sp.]HJK92238.1 sigma-70 family RNA polymerase sigma factor [Polyangiaceae bacterium LLY-WYZ-15_(1-7)]MBJ70162.1 hypothetical protein [Sandaracinus sp.]HJL06699.1 sigma-70 family RNA polymerase sigma factor [Polyangiaceae bacterium LLY-WYZ-15_(1-7)]HJL13420.1 sigma-70 family RNA polymerase sigma factor [Polyangiaceae bacterium LLY-WYZ-15_(1-7)]
MSSSPRPADAARALPGALAREPGAVRVFVAALTPVIQARVARALHRRGGLAGREVRQEVRDLTQEVFVALFADDARVLRRWDGDKGLSLPNFVGLVAEREAGAILRSKRRSPFTDEPTEGAALERRSGAARSVEREVGARDLLRALLARLEEELSPLGAQIFDLVWRQQKSTEQVCAELGMSKDAVHAWRSRIMKKARALRAELERGAEVGA